MMDALVSNYHAFMAVLETNWVFALLFAAVAGTTIGCAIGAPLGNALEYWSYKRRFTPAKLVEGPMAASEPGTTWVIVDVQTKFLKRFPRAYREQLRLSVLSEIDTAIAHGAPIVVLELHKSWIALTDSLVFLLKGYGQTDSLIKKRLRNYERVWYGLKRTNSGSDEVLMACRAAGFDTKVFRICGLNSDACVLETARGLNASGGVCVEVVVDACITCNTPSYNWSHYMVDENQPRLVRQLNLAPNQRSS